MRITNKYIFFYRDKIAQWHMADMIAPPLATKYNCCEQYMMHQKALLFEDREIAERIMKAVKPKEHQDLGKLVKGFDKEVWDANKYNIVANGNWLKFTQNTYLLKELLDLPHDKIFVEASPIDLVWGVGLDENNPKIDDEINWRGQNLLGKVITETRNRILEQLSYENNCYTINK